MTQEGTESLITETPGFSICRAMKCSKQSIYPSTVSLHIAFSKKNHILSFAFLLYKVVYTEQRFSLERSSPPPCPVPQLRHSW